jgi:hypothetical protein
MIGTIHDVLGFDLADLHPVQYLALAYGHLPQLVRRLREPIRELVL